MLATAKALIATHLGIGFWLFKTLNKANAMITFPKLVTKAIIEVPSGFMVSLKYTVVIIDIVKHVKLIITLKGL